MTHLECDLYWSMRSPYCYLVLDRVLELARTKNVALTLKFVYPIAIRDPGFLARAPRHFGPYNLLDSERVADQLGIPFRRPSPDPIIQDPETGTIADDQPYARRLTRLAAAAAEKGQGLAFLDQVMRVLWDGSTENWHEGDHLANAIDRAGLDAEALMREVAVHPDTLDTSLETNALAQAKAGHGGVPLFVFRDEPFFGQDRFDLLIWRMQQHGLRPRDDA